MKPFGSESPALFLHKSHACTDILRCEQDGRHLNVKNMVVD